jgi:SAM-dependent methyltransferase
MVSKILHKLSKKASRKNLINFIELSFKNELDKNRKIKVLNIGSGGELEDLIKKTFRNVYSIDIDKKRSPDQLLDVCDIDFQDKIKIKPSLVCCFEVLEHTKNPNKAIKNIYNILDKDDYFLASVPFNFHIHDEPNDFFRFTYFGLKMLFNDFSKVTIKRRNGWLESIFVNIIRLEKEKNILSKFVGKAFILIYFILLPLILIFQKLVVSNKLTTGYYIEAKK